MKKNKIKSFDELQDNYMNNIISILKNSNKKKCNFINEVLYKTKTNSIVHNCRIECLPYLNPSLIMARALAPTQKLLTLCMDYMIRGNSNYSKKDALDNMPNLLFLKGKSCNSEILELLNND